jgi:transcriptional regulator with XRE-family HTH domain
MTLDSYLKSAGITQAEFAATLGTTQAAVSRYARGLRYPKRATLNRIIAASGGNVTANDFLSSRTQTDRAA